MIQFPIILDYAMSLAILFQVGLASSILICRLLGPVFIRNHWFEHALFTWGWMTGIMAIVLLRIVDNDNKTRTLDHFAFAYLFVVPIEVTMVTPCVRLVVASNI